MTLIQGRVQGGVGGNNAAAIANFNRAITLFETCGQWPIAWNGQPQPPHEAPKAGIGPVDKGAAVMEQGMVVDELHVSRLQLHANMERGVVGQGVEQVQRCDMGIG